jgi:hypothetical protein
LVRQFREVRCSLGSRLTRISGFERYFLSIISANPYEIHIGPDSTSISTNSFIACRCGRAAKGANRQEAGRTKWQVEATSTKRGEAVSAGTRRARSGGP